MKNRLCLAVCVGVAGVFLVFPSAGRAQAVSLDVESLQQRLSAIDMRLNAIESKKGNRALALPAGSAAYTANDLESRMTELEQEMSQNAGQSERTAFAIQQLAKHFDALSKDLELRLGDIENRLQKVEATPAPPSVSAPAVAVATGTEPEAAPAAPAVQASGSPQDMYNKAYAYLSAADYPHAQAGLEAFLKKYPKDALADNAYYWLGEVYLVQNNPTAAVVKFRDGLKAFPKGQKAPSNLYKMGIALEQLKQPILAKGAWQKLLKDYPTAPEAAKAKTKLTTAK